MKRGDTLKLRLALRKDTLYSGAELHTHIETLALYVKTHGFGPANTAHHFARLWLEDNVLQPKIKKYGKRKTKYKNKY